jgi:hypothetical protein
MSGYGRHLLIVLAVSFVLGFSLTGVAGYSTTRVNAQSRPGSVEFRHGEDVPVQYQQEIEEGTYLAKDYLFRTWNLILPRPVVVESLASDGVAGYAGPDYVGFSTGSIVWIDTTARQRIKIAVHEYLHVAQHALGQGARGWAWLAEGSAEYFAYAAVIEAGIVDPNDAALFHQFNVAYAPSMPSIRDLETTMDFSQGPVYSLAYLAVEQLALRSGAEAFRSYFELLGGSATHDDAFREAFGLEASAFYDEFDALRASIVLPAGPPATLLPPGPVLAYPAPFSIVSMTSPIAAGEQALLQVVTDPSVRCSLDIYTNEGNVISSRPTQADLAGIALWFWTVDRGPSPGLLSLAIGCGGEPVFTSLEVT